MFSGQLQQQFDHAEIYFMARGNVKSKTEIQKKAENLGIACHEFKT